MVGYTNLERPLKIDLPKDSAFLASTTALCFQVALRLSRFDFDVFFLGTAIIANTIFDNLSSISPSQKNVAPASLLGIKISRLIWGSIGWIYLG